jgi:hypothetical protein
MTRIVTPGCPQHVAAINHLGSRLGDQSRLTGSSHQPLEQHPFQPAVQQLAAEVAQDGGIKADVLQAVILIEFWFSGTLDEPNSRNQPAYSRRWPRRSKLPRQKPSTRNPARCGNSGLVSSIATAFLEEP